MLVSVTATTIFFTQTKEKTIAPFPSVENMDNFIGYLNSHPDDIFIFDLATSLHSNSYYLNPLVAMPKGMLKNLNGFGGWSKTSPYPNDALASFGLENTYEDIINNGHVYVVDNEAIPIDVKETFFNEYYAKANEDIYYDYVGAVYEYKLWQVKTRSK
jgi:hypothetical protein